MKRYSILFAATLFAGCAGSASSPSMIAPTGAQSVTAPIGSLVQAQSRSASPESCGQRVHFVAHPRGGSFQVPHCGGWSGTIAFPTARIRSVWSVQSSVTNDFGAPSPPSGSPIFYMQTALHHPVGTGFHDDGVDDTVTGPGLSAGHTYTLNVYNFLYNDQCPSTQCVWTMNIGSPQPGSHSITFTSPLNGAVVVSAGTPGAPVWQFVQN